MFVVAWRLHARPRLHARARPASARAATRDVLCAPRSPTAEEPSGAVGDARRAVLPGVGIYAFYAMQPFLLELYGDPKAYSVAGLAAAIVAGAQIAGGYAAPKIRRLFRKRTTALILGDRCRFASSSPCSASSTPSGSRWRSSSSGG